MRCLDSITADGYTFPCGSCIACAARAAGQREAVQRLEHMACDYRGLFITLTYTQERLPRTTEVKRVVVYRDTQLNWIDTQSKIYQFDYHAVPWDEVPESDQDEYWSNLYDYYFKNQVLLFKRRNKGASPKGRGIADLMAKAEQKVSQAQETYAPAHLAWILPGAPTLEVKHIQDFHKRLRIQIDREFGWRYRHFTVGELGSLRGRPHWHVNLFFDDTPPMRAKRILRKLQSTIRSKWPFGECHQQVMDQRHNGYSVKYLAKKRRGFQTPRSPDDLSACSVLGTPEIITTQSTGNGREGTFAIGDKAIPMLRREIHRAAVRFARMSKKDRFDVMQLILRLRQDVGVDHDDIAFLMPAGLTMDDYGAVDMLTQVAQGSYPFGVYKTDKKTKRTRYRVIAFPLPYKFRMKLFDGIMSDDSRKKMNAALAESQRIIDDLRTPHMIQAERERSIAAQERYAAGLRRSENKAANQWTN